MNKVRTYEGGCHCGRVRFRVTADLETVSICNCSICTKKGIIHLIVPPERFELVCGKDDLTTYTFNTGVAKRTFSNTAASTRSTCRVLTRTRSTSMHAASMILISGC